MRLRRSKKEEPQAPEDQASGQQLDPPAPGEEAAATGPSTADGDEAAAADGGVKPPEFEAAPLVKQQAPSAKSSASKGLIFSLVVFGIAAAVFFIGPALLPKPGPPAEQVLSKMATELKSEQSRSASFSGSISVSTKGGMNEELDESADINGAFAGNELELKIGADDGQQFELRVLRDAIYFKDPKSGTWQVFPLEIFTMLAGKQPQQSPMKGEAFVSELLSGLRKLDGQTFEGPTIDGVETWEIRPSLADFNLGTDDEAVNPLAKASLKLYVGRQDGLPRRIESSGTIEASSLGESPLATYATSATIGFEIEFADWGKKIKIKRPAKAENQFKELQEILESGDLSQLQQLAGQAP